MNKTYRPIILKLLKGHLRGVVFFPIHSKIQFKHLPGHVQLHIVVENDVCACSDKITGASCRKTCGKHIPNPEMLRFKEKN